MKSFLLSLVICCCFLSGCTNLDTAISKSQPGQSGKLFDEKVAIDAKLGYLLYLPKNYSADKQWPLVMFLHGVGERGNNLEKIKAHGLAKLAEKQDFPFIIVSPQCPDDTWWDISTQVESLNGLLDNIIDSYSVDTKRVYLTGLSMGGFGTWALASAHSEKFAAIVPICGGGNHHNVKKLAKLPIWVFHGDKDGVVPIKRSQEMVDAIKKENGDIKFTVYPGVGHDSWTQTYNNPELYKWLLNHTKQ